MRHSAVALTAAAVLMAVGTGCDKLAARDHINKGVQAFKSAKYPEAVEHFKTAVEKDPDYTNARIYLATAYMNQYIPGADSPENMALAKAANDEFLRVLDKDPNDKMAIASLASLHYQQANGVPKLEEKLMKLDDARKWYEKLAQVDPQNKEAYYSLGVISWAKCYPARAEVRNKLGMKPDDPGPIKDPKVKDELRGKCGTMIDEGIKNLEKALSIDPNYDDAMAYMNLLIRERADVVDNKEDYAREIESANKWIEKSLETRKAKAAQQPAAGSGGGI